MSNRTYDVLKWIVALVLPATATLYSVLSSIWGLPFRDRIPETITAVNVFLGSVLMISSAQYSKKTA